MNWSAVIVEASAEVFRSRLETNFALSHPDAPDAVRAQFADLADAADALVQKGHLGVAPFNATLQGYVSEPGGESKSNSIGFSVIGRTPDE